MRVPVLASCESPHEHTVWHRLAGWRRCGAKRVSYEDSLWAHAGGCTAVAGMQSIEQRLQQHLAAAAAAKAQAAAAEAQLRRQAEARVQQRAGSRGAGGETGMQPGSEASSGQRHSSQHHQQRQQQGTAPAPAGRPAGRGARVRPAPANVAGVRLAALREELASAEQVVLLVKHCLLLMRDTAGHICRTCMRVLCACDGRPHRKSNWAPLR